jgi:cobalt-zinc-cadmium efflux system outer membrane protein
VVQHQRTFSGAAERETIVGLSLPLGVGGRRVLLQDAAAARREQAFAEADVTLFESALSFREGYITAIISQARAEVLNEQQVALDALSDTIEALAKGGEAAAYDLLRQRVQARLHRGLVESATAHALASRALIEAWTDAAVVLPPLDLSALLGGSATSVPSDASPQTRRVQSLEALSRASVLEARAARRRWVPDLELFAGYRSLDADGDVARGVSLGLTVPLTFFDHGQGDAARADAERELASASADRLRREQSAEAKAARVRLEHLLVGAAELGQGSSDAHALLTQAQQLYAAGEANITEVLEAFRAAEEARLAELDLALQVALARVLLMSATGTMLDANLDHACTRTEQRTP